MRPRRAQRDLAGRRRQGPCAAARPSSVRTSASERSNTVLHPLASCSAATKASRQASAPAARNCTTRTCHSDRRSARAARPTRRAPAGNPNDARRAAARERARHGVRVAAGIQRRWCRGRRNSTRAHESATAGSMPRSRETRRLPNARRRSRLSRDFPRRARLRRKKSMDAVAAAISRVRPSA